MLNFRNFKLLCLGVALSGQALALSPGSGTSVITTSQTGPSAYYIAKSQGVLQFDPSLLGALSTAGVSFSAVSPAVYDPATAKITTAVSAVSYNTADKAFSSLTTLGGGSFTMPKETSLFGIKIGGPGEITFTNLSVDINNKTVRADVTGTNSVLPGNYDIFTFQNLVGDVTFNGAGNYALTASGLSLTTTGVNLVTTALKLGALGSSTLASVQNLGSISAAVTINNTAPVPEPSTYLLVILGLMSVIVISKRRSHQ